MKKAFASMIAAVMMVSLLAACGGNQAPAPAPAPAAPAAPEAQAPAAADPAAPEVQVFKIGGTAPLTGGAAIFGNAVRNGATIAVDEINARGGNIQFDLRYEDDEHNAEIAVNAFNILKDWGIQISLLSVTSTPGAATNVEHYENRIFGMTPSASSTRITEGNDNVFQMCFTDPAQGTSAATYIFNNNLGTDIAVIYKNDDVYSSGIFNTFESKARELGLNVVSVTTFTDDSANDFSVQLADAQRNGADLVFLPMYYTPASLILRQASDIGFAPIFFGVDGMDGILAMDGFDPALAEGVILLTPFAADATDPLTVNFVRMYQERFGEVPNQFAAGAYDVVHTFYKMINETGVTADMTAQQICEIFVAHINSGFTFDGVTGTGMSWSPVGEVTKDPKGMVIRNGEYVGL
jgi:branched-chain amino acid transport system substrate-binding protein